MNIEEMQKKKKELENKILQLLSDFESDTGVDIYDLSWDRATIVGQGFPIYDVNVEVRLK